MQPRSYIEKIHLKFNLQMNKLVEETRDKYHEHLKENDKLLLRDLRFSINIENYDFSKLGVPARLMHGYEPTSIKEAIELTTKLLEGLGEKPLSREKSISVINANNLKLFAAEKLTTYLIRVQDFFKEYKLEE